MKKIKNINIDTLYLLLTKNGELREKHILMTLILKRQLLVFYINIDISKNIKTKPFKSIFILIIS